MELKALIDNKIICNNLNSILINPVNENKHKVHFGLEFNVIP